MDDGALSLGRWHRLVPRGAAGLSCDEAGVATSIKSVDLNSAIYQDAGRLAARINRYVDQLAAFNGEELGSMKIEPAAITGRVLKLAVPKGSVSTVQNAALQAARMQARDLGIDLLIIPF
jgi:hypothetical protein